MTARILVVDDILANVRLLEAKLTAEYFDVVTAMNGLDALEAIRRTKPDIILLDVMMPGIDGIEVCKRIKGDPATQHIPVVMVTALDQPEDRVRGLEAGADDFLTKPVNDISLFCRIKSLVRLKMLTDELRVRSEDGTSVGLLVNQGRRDTDVTAQVLLVDAHDLSSEKIISTFDGKYSFVRVKNQQEAVDAVQQTLTPFELIVVNFDNQHYDGLRLCSQLKSLEITRQTPILVIVDPENQPTLLRALDMGVNDYLMRPIDKHELKARVSTQVRRYRYTQRLRASVKASIEMAITDALTGLYNRRYIETHLSHMIEHYINRGKALSVIALDVDFFKSINDTHGHDAGDKVLQELAARMRANTRTVDLCCRTGGEEFIMVLPNTATDLSSRIAERLRRAVASKSVDCGTSQLVPVTVSLGVASLDGADDTLDKLLKRADQALYTAKREGRNRVIVAA
jgi:two-component system, cell cycle response regulator